MEFYSIKQRRYDGNENPDHRFSITKKKTEISMERKYSKLFACELLVVAL